MANEGKTVIVAALDGTFQRQPFGSILNLVPMAESVIKLKAVCMICFSDAAFTKRLGSEKEVGSCTHTHTHAHTHTHTPTHTHTMCETGDCEGGGEVSLPPSLNFTLTHTHTHRVL